MSYTPSRSDRRKRRSPTSKSPSATSRRRTGSGAGNSDRYADDVTITRPSGNVFLDLGFSCAEAEGLLLRANLMDEIEQIITRRKLTQASAAKLFGVTQPRISDLMRGKFDRFSIDGLIVMLAHAGMHVTIQIKPAA